MLTWCKFYGTICVILVLKRLYSHISKFDRLLQYTACTALFLFVFSFNFVLITDPDFGWHLRYGEAVIKTGHISTIDTFSYTMRGQPLVDTEWFPETLYYLLYTKGSLLLLIGISALATTLAFLLPVFVTSGGMFAKGLIVFWSVVGSAQVLGVGPRPQNVTFLCFSILLYLLLKFSRTKRMRFLIFIPFLMLVWANSHPAFYIGLVLLTVFLLLESIFVIADFISRKTHTGLPFGKGAIIPILLLLTIMFISVFATNLRPQQGQSGKFSFDLIGTFALPVSVATLTSPSGNVRTKIAEWLPPILVDVPGTLFLLGIIYAVSVFIDRQLTRKDIMNLSLLSGFIYFSTLSRRNLPFFFLVFLWLLIPYMDELIRTIKNKKAVWMIRWIGLFLMVSIGTAKLLLSGDSIVKNTSFPSYCETMGFPCKAVEFIKNNKTLLMGNMFNHYNWGGYLIWQLPQYPVFIDGRVPGGKIFTEFESIDQMKEGWEKIVDSYKIDWMLVPKNPLFETALSMNGTWKVVYEDTQSVVLKKI